MRLSLITFAGLASLALAVSGGAPAEQVDNELRRLQKARFEAAVVEMEATIALYDSGRASLAASCESIKRFSESGLQVARTGKYRRTVCERAAEIARSL